ncbi:MAG: hypothetical protein ABWY06_25330 [Pseudomonas sp.]|uniref:hypothetical protein n=1 Tax=Pseudomonas sp. TaxID=306 RepID=UPI00339B836A
MRVLAEFIMRGRVQATFVVVAAAILPLLFWLSCAAACLVLLRRGARDALGILAWALLPALLWCYLGDPRLLFVSAGALGLALLLRAGFSWSVVLLCSVALGLLYAGILSAVPALREPIEAVSKELLGFWPQMLGAQEPQLPDAQRKLIEASLSVPALIGFTAMTLQVISLLCLVLARYWQALLYNPGGFGREFRALRLPAGVASVLLVSVLLVANLGPQWAALKPFFSVPLIMAGLALLHGVVAEKPAFRFWLIGTYVCLVVVYPLLIMLAVVDSLIDFRGRLARSKGVKNDSANGEG